MLFPLRKDEIREAEASNKTRFFREVNPKDMVYRSVPQHQQESSFDRELGTLYIYASNRSMIANQ